MTAMALLQGEGLVCLWRAQVHPGGWSSPQEEEGQWAPQRAPREVESVFQEVRSKVRDQVCPSLKEMDPVCC